MKAIIRTSSYRIATIGAFVVQAFLLFIVHRIWRQGINEDAVPYIRIAQYYLKSDGELMISGYWGPLLSWLIAPWLLLFDEPLFAAHAAMAISAGIFAIACYCVLQACKLSKAAVLAGTWICALVSVNWSVVLISPDLLEAGFLGFAIALFISDQWSRGRAVPILSGLLLGIAYLAKAVALPISLLLVAFLAGQHVCVGTAGLRQVARSCLLTLFGVAVVAGPWIYVLSQHYGGFVFSTSGQINHALVGPPDVERYHPAFRTFHRPEAGRVTSWEDPSPETYQHWSPLDDWRHAKHQARLVYINARQIVQTLVGFDWLGLGLASALLGHAFCSNWRQTQRSERWRWCLLPVFCGSAIYLPIYADSVRYFWPTFPFLLAAALGFTGHLAKAWPRSSIIGAFLSLGLVTLSYVVAHESMIRGRFQTPHFSEYTLAKLLAGRLEDKGLVGPIASVAWYEIGYYVAFILDVPWHGNMRSVDSIDEVLGSDARLIFAPRGILTPLLEGHQFSAAPEEDMHIPCEGPTGAAELDIFLIEGGNLLPLCS